MYDIHTTKNTSRATQLNQTALPTVGTKTMIQFWISFAKFYCQYLLLLWLRHKNNHVTEYSILIQSLPLPEKRNLNI